MSTGTKTKRQIWMAKRRKGIGASDAASIVGVRKDPSRFRIYLDKRGEIEPDEPNEAMLMGLAAEPAILAMYEQRTGRIIQDTQLHVSNDAYPFMLATLDAMDENDEIIECKLAGTWTTRNLPDDGDAAGLPEAWIIQAQHQMVVMGAARVHFAVWAADPSFRLYVVERDETLIAEMIRLEEAFWAQVQDGTPPAEFGADDLQAITRHFNREEPEALQLDPADFGEAAKEYTEATAEIKYAEGLRDGAKAELLMAMQNAAVATCGPYTIKRKVVQTKERTQVVKAGSYVRFTCVEKEGSDE